MSVQPEVLKFGPQWIRELSDGAFIRVEQSNYNNLKDVQDRTNLGFTNAEAKFSNSPGHLPSNYFAHYRADLPAQFSAMRTQNKEFRTSKSPGNKDYPCGFVPHLSESVKEYPRNVSSRAGSGYDCDVGIGTSSPRNSDSSHHISLSWHQQSTDPTFNTELNWPNQPMKLTTGSNSCDRETNSIHSQTSEHIRSATSPVSPRYSPSTNTSTARYLSHVDSDIPSNSDMENSTFNASRPSFFDFNLDANCHAFKQTTGFIQESDEVGLDSVWMHQQQMWSKSVPQHLPSLILSEASRPSTISDTTSSECNVSLFRQSSCSVPDSDCLTNNLDHFSAFNQLVVSSASMTLQNQYNTLQDERGLHRPDGADQPDEHLWLYEDPQGRTQGSFSDAQMNEWLLAGIYFTPNLRIRRKCDDTFSTLASYTQLFGRVPFVSGHRVAPLRGGITLAMLNSGSGPTLNTSHHSQSDNNYGVKGSGVVPFTQSSMEAGLYSGICSLLDGPNLNNVDRAPFIEHPLSMNQQSPLKHLDQNSPIGTSGPVMTMLTNTMNTLGIRGTNGQNLDVAFENSVQLSRSNSTMTNSTFMNLASFVAMNPTLSSLALPFTSQMLDDRDGAPMDLASASDALLSPGFLAALAQYLNVQPPTSTHQNSSPMQQLAETAQLAAQLAALAGAHSPDQTPMQPAQALALAQLLMSRWVSLNRKNAVNGTLSAGRNCAVAAVRKDEASFIRENPVSSSFSRDDGCPPTSDSHLDSHWPLLSSVGTRISPRTGDFNGVSNELSDSSLGFRRSNYLTKSQLLKLSPNSRPLASKSKQHTEVSSCESSACQINPANNSPLSTMSNSRSLYNNRGPQTQGMGEQVREEKQNPSSNRTGPNTPWVNKVKQTTDNVTRDYGTTPAKICTPRRSLTDVTTTITTPDSQESTNKSSVKPTSKLSNTIRSPLKGIKSPNALSVSHSELGHGDRKIDTTNSSIVNVLSTSNPVPERSVEDELRRLTEWAQSRLSAIPMREKVDIPTVVELLATLDAPYEVERMVQTFLGESARTSQFVKEFLDRRRPFWQLHRELRELASSTQNTIVVVDSTKTGNLVSNIKSSEPSHGKKKKGSSCESGSASHLQRQQPCNGELGWSKTDIGVEQSHDNQWHYIKPKNSQHRKSKKEKVT